MNATPNEEVTIESMARDLLLLIRSFSWPKVAVTGFSMGGKRPCLATLPRSSDVYTI